MRPRLHLPRVALAATVALAAGAATADSSYGYSPSGAGQRTASAHVNITVTVPKLILLRVGQAGATVDTAALNATLNGGIPGGGTSPVDGSDISTSWDASTAPIWSDATASPVRAYAWTNASGGGQVAGVVSTAFLAGSGLTAGNVLVASSNPLGGGLDHPGTNTGAMGTPTAFPKNTLVASDWTFSISSAGLAGATAGTHTQQVTYTATTL